MTNDACQRYLEDPEAHQLHLAECDSCRALAGTLGQGPDARPLNIGELPMATWEGADHRPWPLLVVAAIAVAAAALAVLAAAGVTPLELFKGRVPSFDVLISMATLAGGAVQNAPREWQVVILIAFVVVNAVFVALLRRAPKGLDV